MSAGEGTDRGQGQGSAGQGDAPPEGSHKEGGWKPPSDGSWLPRVRVNDMIASAVRKAVDETKQQLAQVNEQARAKPAEPPQQFSRAQLSGFVEEGKLTQEAADAIWEKQIVDRATRQAVEAATNAVSSRDQQRTVAQQMAEFKGLVPDAWEEGTPEREQVRKALDRLVGAGIKGAPQELELAALISAFGDPADIRRAKGFGRNGPAESFEDSGGSGARRGGRETDDGDGPPRGLDQHQRAHYERKIASGIYKDWAAVREELKFSGNRRRRA